LFGVVLARLFVDKKRMALLRNPHGWPYQPQ
jgi:hypothetical protein